MNKADRAEHTRLEQEAGARRLMYYQMVEGVEKGEAMLRRAFPSMEINCEIPKPYNIVTVHAWHREDRAVKFFEQVPIRGFPSDELVAKIALIA